MVADSENLVSTCEGYQLFTKQIHASAQELQTIPMSWPIPYRGLDMIGPFKTAYGGYDHILVVMDKFTKWIEVKPIKSLMVSKAAEFIAETTQSFRVPNRIITD